MVLMERAALAAASELCENFDTGRVLVVCGSGNNGADGIALARITALRGINTDIYMAGNIESFTPQAKAQWEIARNYNLNIVNNFEPGEYTTIVDAIFGIGLSRPVTGTYKVLFDKINTSGIPVLSVDIPSGIDGNTGKIMGNAVKASRTVTFAYGKTGLYLYPGASHAGTVTVKDVGIYDSHEEALGDEAHIDVMYALEKEDIKELPQRKADGNKGTFGKVLVIAGSRNMSGAAYFCAKACLFAGAGMVRVFTPECNRIILQQQFPEAMLTAYQEDETCEEIKELLFNAPEWADTVIIGPGLGQSGISRMLVEEIMHADTQKPVVVDADALNIISSEPVLLKNCTRPCILTPHIGEMARLTGKTIAEIKEDLTKTVKGFANENPANIHLILKDARTLTGCHEKDGWKCYLNLTGNSGMATAGSGDTLSGIVGGLLAQGCSCARASYLGVWLHGLAGDRARQKKGERSMTASDILEALPEILPL